MQDDINILEVLPITIQKEWIECLFYNVFLVNVNVFLHVVSQNPFWLQIYVIR